jgi:hypothetical protein
VASPPALAAFDPATRLVLGGAAAAGVAAILGLLVGAWDLDPFALVLILLALVAAGAAYVLEAMVVDDAVKPWPPFAMLASGAVATALTALQVIEMIGDLDDMDDYGGIVGLVLGAIALAASIVILYGAIRRTGPARRPSERGAQIAAVGAALVLLAWVLHLTIGFWSFAPATWGIAAVVLAAVLVWYAGSATRPLAWLGWVALVLALFAAWTAFGQWNALMDVGSSELELGIEDFLPFLIYVAGIVLVLGGAALTAMGGRVALPGTDPTGGSPTANA